MKEVLTSKSEDAIEVRGFGDLRELFQQRDWPLPVYFKLSEEQSDIELAKDLDLPLEKIESVVINGKATPFGKGMIGPGDRVAFVPPGTPGPYRAMLGMVE